MYWLGKYIYGYNGNRWSSDWQGSNDYICVSTGNNILKIKMCKQNIYIVYRHAYQIA